MPSVLNATPKSASANSYVSKAEADAYFDDRLNSAAWTGAAAEDKDRALLMATKRLDEEDYDAVPTTTTQALKWPRAGAVDGDGDSIDQDTIPELIQLATYETAIWMLGEDRQADTGLEGFESLTAGPVSVTPRHARKAGVLPRVVKRILRPVQTSVSRGSTRMVRA